MASLRRLERLFGGRGIVFLLAVALLAGLGWETFAEWGAGMVPRMIVRTVEGVYLGKSPVSVVSDIAGSIESQSVFGGRYRQMAIRHIPRIDKNDSMPHSYVGACKQCHLYRGGPGPGHQPNTRVGTVLESLSRLKKLGPPLRPNSRMPHPPGGRCIKCHDIVVKVPVEKTLGGLTWVN